MDYEALGLKAGIEIHQQLNTREKLFCRCPTTLRKFEDRSGEFYRYLRATVSEMGEIDRAAREEMKQSRKFRYYTYDTTCLVENDEEPPAPLNTEALEICLTIGKMFQMTPIEQVHTMRKLVIDGSNTSGFQRTALVAINGVLPGGGLIETICLEEEAAQRVEDETFSLDRLGIPLVEITTSPCMHTPEQVQKVAGYMGMVLRSTGRVKRGLGTIRQDVNISVRDGARVEIKGVQELDLIAEVVRREVQRQVGLIAIREELRARNASAGEEAIDVTGLFSGTASSVLKKANVILALKLPGFGGLVGREIQPGRRLGSEFSDYARKCGVGGIFHTDELPAYGVTGDEVAALKAVSGAREQDCVILVAATREKAACAVSQVIRRAQMALEQVPEETRKMLEGGSTSYMRPLPGAARMYPETDVLPVCIRPDVMDNLSLPELLTTKADRFARDLKFDPAVARQIAYSEQLPIFEKAVTEGITPMLAYRTIYGTFKELKREGVPVDDISEGSLIAVLKAVEEGKAAKEAIPGILTKVAEGMAVETAVNECSPSLSRSDLEDIVRRILTERSDFIREKKQAALGPLMGVVMAEVRGAVDGKLVSEVLRKELERVLNA
jgi:glutamyl-tRNA(Gln) amidotransferase subunit E